MVHEMGVVFALKFALLGLADAQYGMLDFSPRFMFGESGMVSLGAIAKRQEVDSCGVGMHSCFEVHNSSSACCANDEYCYFSPLNVVKCCTIGLTCDNICSSSSASASAIAVNQTYTLNPSSTTTNTSCSPRACPATSAFLCAPDLCCSYHSTCGLIGAASTTGCISTTDSHTTAASTSTSPTCPTGQFACPEQEGGGCCGVGAKYTAKEATLLCVVTTGASITGSEGGLVTLVPTTAIRTGSNGILDSNFTDVSSNSSSSSSSSLSSGAKAGVGVGVALAVILALLGILCFARSRRQARSRSDGVVGGGPFFPGSRRRRDYFGPEATVGPYTVKEFEAGGGRGGGGGAVPLSPHWPADIAAPVEIGDSTQIVPEKPEFRVDLP